MGDRKWGIDLIDTRKRKAPRDSHSPERRHEPHDLYPPPPTPVSMHRYPANLDLGRMLYPDRIKPDTYHRIQTLLKTQDKTIVERGAEIKDRCAQIHELKSELKDVHNKLGEHERTITALRDDKHRLQAGETSVRSLREKKAYFQQLSEDKEELLNAGAKFLAEKTAAVKKLEGETQQLRDTVTQRDATVSKLNQRVWDMVRAPGNEMMSIALEAQAEQTLGLVQGLKADVARRGSRIEGLEGRAKAVGERNGELTRMVEKKEREVEDLKRELKKLEGVAGEAARKAKEAEEISDEQAGLIRKLMDENARLAGLREG